MIAKAKKKTAKSLKSNGVFFSGSLKKAEKRLRAWCHKYICLRDLRKTESGEIVGKCISCGRMFVLTLFSDQTMYNGRGWHAGHYWKEDRYASVRYDERNINGQHSNCNVYKSGDEANYEIGLRAKIGDDKFEQLKIDRNKIKHWDIIEVEKLTEEFKRKAKIEAERLGIKL